MRSFCSFFFVSRLSLYYLNLFVFPQLQGCLMLKIYAFLRKCSKHNSNKGHNIGEQVEKGEGVPCRISRIDKDMGLALQHMF